MPNQIDVRELQYHRLKGFFPDVATYTDVDISLLTAGDATPFFITLAIAEIGRVSENGLLYDRELVYSIAEQLAGLGGIRGHIPEGEEVSAFPVDAVDWVGHNIDGSGKLWAKAYVPPGETREQLRRLKARGGRLGTSIYGFGERQMLDAGNGTWKLNRFELHSVDLAPAQRASLKLGGGFQITAEMQQEAHHEEKQMTETAIRLSDVPLDVRQQIIEQAQMEAEMVRVAELREALTVSHNRISELETTLHNRDAQIAELEQLVTARAGQIRELQEAQFTAELEQRIAALTDWQVGDEAARSKLEKVRTLLRQTTLAELQGKRESGALESALIHAFEEQRLILETVRDALSGPSVALAPRGKATHASNSLEYYRTDEGLEELRRKWNR
jgi:hypothetical protein